MAASNNISLLVSLSGIQQTTAGLRTVAGAIGSISGAVTMVSRAFPALTAAVTSALSVSAMLDAAKRAIDTADAMGKLSQKAGQTVTDFSALAYSAKLNEITQDQLRNSSRELSEELVKQGRAGDSLREEYLKLADQMAQLPDGAAKIALANQRLGKSGQEMIPWLSQGRAAIEAQMSEAKDFGVVIGPQFAAQADTFNDNLARMKSMLEGVFLQSMARILPELNRLSEAVIDFTKNSGLLDLAVKMIVQNFQAWSYNLAAVQFAFRGITGFVSTFFGAMSDGKTVSEAFNDALAKGRDIAADFAKRLKEIRELGIPKPDQSGRPTSAENPTFAFERERKARAESNKELERTISLERSRIQSDFRLTEPQKFEALKNLYAAEVELLGQQIKDLNERKRLLEETGDPFGEIQNIDLQLGDVNREWVQAGERRDTFDRTTVDPTSLGDQMTQQFTLLQDQTVTVAQGIAQTFRTVIGSAVESISAGITGLIMRTKTWGQALQEIGTSFLTAIINKIVEMGVQWVVTHVLMRGVMIVTQAIGEMLGWKQVAATEQQEMAKAPGLAANAASASIGSYGAAGVVGMVVAIAAIGAIIAAALGAFAQGGPVSGPGSSTSDSIIARLSAGEYVVNAAAVNSIGLEGMEMINDGQLPIVERPVPVAAQSSEERREMKVVLVDDRAKALAALRTAEGEALIVDTVGRNMHRFRH